MDTCFQDPACGIPARTAVSATCPLTASPASQSSLEKSQLVLRSGDLHAVGSHQTLHSCLLHVTYWTVWISETRTREQVVLLEVVPEVLAWVGGIPTMDAPSSATRELGAVSQLEGRVAGKRGVYPLTSPLPPSLVEFCAPSSHLGALWQPRKRLNGPESLRLYLRSLQCVPGHCIPRPGGQGTQVCTPSSPEAPWSPAGRRRDTVPSMLPSHRCTCLIVLDHILAVAHVRASLQLQEDPQDLEQSAHGTAQHHLFNLTFRINTPAPSQELLPARPVTGIGWDCWQAPLTPCPSPLPASLCAVHVTSP